jgi:hypothetical protein
MTTATAHPSIGAGSAVDPRGTPMELAPRVVASSIDELLAGASRRKPPNRCRARPSNGS